MISTIKKSMTTIKAVLFEYLKQVQPDITAFCTKLLQTPSVNGVHDEIAIARVIEAEAKQLDLPVQLVGQNPKRPNVIVSTHPEGPTGLLLVGHLDTVPTGDESQWTHPPFTGQQSDGKLFGRGAIDTKGGMAAALYALTALKQLDLPKGRAQLICVPDEESGATGTLGVKYLHQQGLLQALGAIYAYSGQKIALGHRGVIRYQLTVRGEAAHTGMAGKQTTPAPGHNAVLGLADLLLRLEEIDLPFSSQPYFHQFRPVITPGTVITGGTAINVVPDFAQALVDIRTTPEFELGEAQTILNELIAAIQQVRPGLHIEYQLLNHLPAAISDNSAPLFTVLEHVVENVHGFTPERVVAGPANEGYLFIERGIPIVCGFGPTGANAHAADEYVDVDSLVDAALIFALTAYELAQTL